MIYPPTNGLKHGTACRSMSNIPQQSFLGPSTVFHSFIPPFTIGIDIVFSLLGSTASSLLCFIFPAYLAYCAGTHRTSRAVCVGMVLLALLGLFIGILGTWCTISERILK